jgi:hypothetical protein
MSTPNLKRDNWTNEEVIHLLEDMRLYSLGGEPIEDPYPYNEVLNDAANRFRDFRRSTEEPGALAFDPITKITYHVGPRLPR